MTLLLIMIQVNNEQPNNELLGKKTSLQSTEQEVIDIQLNHKEFLFLILKM